jgi:hypothetical protein
MPPPRFSFPGVVFSKKLLLPGLLAFFTLTTHAQNGIFWSDPVTVAASTFGDDSPRIALLADGSPAVLWGKSGLNAKIYFSRWNNDAFTDPMQINTNGLAPEVYSFGGLDLATHGSHVFLVFENFNNGIFLVRSTDGGQSFELPVSVFDPPPGDWATLASVGVTDAGNPLVSVIRQLTNETEARYVMMRSADGGLTFSLPVVASEPANGEFVCECCPSDIFSKNDNVWLAFRNNDNNLRDAWVSRSADGGATFDAAADVDATDWNLNACPISGIKIAPLGGDSLITAWMSGASGLGRVSFSTLHGSTMEKGWEFGFPQSNTNSQQVRPDIAGANDTIGVVWEETGFGLNSTDLMFAFSKNGAAGLTQNFTNITQATGLQRYPALAYANGFFHLVYADANGTLKYRKGTVSEVNSAGDFEKNELTVELVTQPVRENLLLRVQSPVSRQFDVALLDAGGRVLKNWPDVLAAAGEFLVKLEAGQVAPGLHFLQVKTEGRVLVKKVIFQP